MLPIKVFYCYSHKDEQLRDELEKSLALLRRQGVIESWHFRKITGGREWENEIDKNLEDSRIIMLLVSADFINSDYCCDIEMKRAMYLHKAGKARVIPIILRAVYWESAPFGKLQALPRDGKPVTSWANIDEAFYNITLGIKQVCDEIQKEVQLEKKSSERNKGALDKTIKELDSVIYCSRCGVKAGERTECVGLYYYHDFEIQR